MIRLTFENFNPSSLYDFKTSELRILLKYCIAETIDITSENSIIPLLIENDKYTILDDIVKNYELSQTEFDYMIEMCIHLKKVKCLNVIRKYYQQ